MLKGIYRNVTKTFLFKSPEKLAEITFTVIDKIEKLLLYRIAINLFVLMIDE